MNIDLEALRRWFETLPTHDMMLDTRWAWPISESIHFFGLCLLIGTVGLFDLRLMGVAKQLSPALLHRLIPFGIAGFFLNVTTGTFFLSATPDQYIYNNAFRAKVVFLAIAGINVLLFYTTMFRKVRTLGPGDDVPLPAKVIGAVSLSMWIAVISAGRFLTFYRPIFIE